MHPKDVIQTIGAALRQHGEMRGLYLSGSYGRNLADDHSDIDFVVVAREPAIAQFSQLWRTALSRVGTLLMFRHRSAEGELFNAIVDDWLRVDVEAFTVEQFLKRSSDGLKPIFDHDGLLKSLPAQNPNAPLDLRHFEWQVTEFIRILGLLALVIGRQELINGVTGAFLMRGLLIDLLVEQTNAPARGGKLHVNRLITPQQRRIIETMPPLISDPDSLVEAYLKYAAAYLPQARALAAQYKMNWPEAFEEATWQHLSRALDVKKPYVAASKQPLD